MPMSTTELHLQQLKWPIEYLFVGAKVRDYFAGSTDALKRQYLQDWDRYHVITENTYNSSGQVVLRSQALTVTAGAQLGIGAGGLITGAGAPLANVALAVGDQVQIAGALYVVGAAVAAGAPLINTQLVPAPGAIIVNSAANATNATKVSYQGLEVQTKSCTPILDTLSIQAHGIDLYKEMPAGFFNAYTTYHFGGPNINAPQDCGSLFVPFCLYPGTYQPSGHINVSRAREFYLKYSSAYQNANPAVALMLVVIASAINFLLISDKQSLSVSALNRRQVRIHKILAKLSNCGKLLRALITTLIQ